MDCSPDEIILNFENETDQSAQSTNTFSSIKPDVHLEHISIKQEHMDSVEVKQENVEFNLNHTDVPILEVKKEFDLMQIKQEEVDFMDVKQEVQSSDLEFSDDSDSDTSEVDFIVGEKKITVNKSDLEETEFDGTDLLPKATLNELDENKIELMLLAKKLPESLPSDSPIAPLGKIFAITGPHRIIIESTLKQTNNKKNLRVLDEDTILVLEDRSVVGTIFEPFGPVSRPLYLVRFPKTSQLKENPVTDEISLDIEQQDSSMPACDASLNKQASQSIDAPTKKFQVGQEIFYAINAAKMVAVSEILKLKGTDASNQNDEEVDSDEMEFSDDEKEQEYRSRRRNRKRPTTNNNSRTNSVNVSIRKRNGRSRSTKRKIDEDDPRNSSLSYNQNNSNQNGDEFSRLLRSYEDL